MGSQRSYIHQVKIKLGQPTIDLFASRGNNKVKTFYSFYPDSLVSQVDAFSFYWSQDIIYAFPPFNLIPRVLQKIENEKIEENLIVPIFVNKSWFTRLLNLLIKESLWLLSSDISLIFPYWRRLSNLNLAKKRIDGLLCIRRCLQEQDIPSKIADIIVQLWRPATSRKYNIYTSKWVQFCSERNYSPYETIVNQILLFLYDLFKSGVGYSVMNTARSSLSTFINIDGLPVSQYQVITRFMKGILNIKPALPKYKFTWDVGIVITYISKIDTNSLEYLSQKLATVSVPVWPEMWRDIIGVGH